MWEAVQALEVGCGEQQTLQHVCDGCVSRGDEFLAQGSHLVASMQTTVGGDVVQVLYNVCRQQG